MDLKYTIINNDYSNIKQVLREKFNISSRLFLRLRNEGHIFLNGNIVSCKEDLYLNDTIEVDLNFVEDNSNIVATKMDLDILYEDKYMLIVNKPAGIAVHPSILHYDTSLSNGVKYYFDSIGLHRKIRIVNRLDRDTSGIVIFAKNEYIQECLTYQMKTKTFKKEYIGILKGILDKKCGTINAPIARKERKHYRKMY